MPASTNCLPTPGIGDDKNFCSCYNYNVINDKGNEVADLNLARAGASCTVFEGKIVVTWGFSAAKNCQLKSVEAYDYHENKWTYLPDIIKERYCHASVSMGNKMFVIGGKLTASCEVFDSVSRKFTAIKSEIILSAADTNFFNAFCIGYNIVVFQQSLESCETDVQMYEVNKSRWSQIESYSFLSSYSKY